MPSLTAEQITTIATVAAAIALFLLRHEANRIIQAADRMELLAYRVEQVEKEQSEMRRHMEATDLRANIHSERIYALEKGGK